MLLLLLLLGRESMEHHFLCLVLSILICAVISATPVSVVLIAVIFIVMPVLLVSIAIGVGGWRSRG